MKIPDFYEEPNHEHNLIIEICQRVDGIGKVTAMHIAGYLDTAEGFMNSSAGDLLAITKVSGAPLLKNEQAEAIVAVRDRFLPSGVMDAQQLWITYLVRDFVERVVKEIKETDFDKLLINPFLIKAFNFTDHKEVITFCFYQKVARSIITSWGETVERMSLISGGAPITHPFGNDFGNDEDVWRHHREFDREVEYTLADPRLWSVIAQELGGLKNFLAWIESTSSPCPSIGDLLAKQLLALIEECERRYSNGAMSAERFLGMVSNGEANDATLGDAI